MDLEPILAKLDALGTDNFYIEIKRGVVPTASQIAEAEATLGLELPADYRAFLGRYGALAASPILGGSKRTACCILGVGQSDDSLDLIGRLKFFREEMGGPGRMTDERDDEDDEEADLVAKFTLVPFICGGPYDFQNATCLSRDGVLRLRDCSIQKALKSATEGIEQRLSSLEEYWRDPGKRA